MSDVTTACLGCDCPIPFAGRIFRGELVTCPACGAEYEVVSIDPLTLEEAPETQLDSGE